MPETFTKEAVTRSIQTFKDRRDALQSGDTDHFYHNLGRFVRLCKTDSLLVQLLSEVEGACEVDTAAVLEEAHDGEGAFSVPDDPNEEICFLWVLTQRALADHQFVFHFGLRFGGNSQSDWINHFRTLIVQPLAKQLSRRLSDAANLATPEARDLQAIPLSRIPSEKEVRIFLSHKTADKPLVRRYYHALKELGFKPWLDEADMKAGTGRERGLLAGFEESCAAVFFVTRNFKDESFLATEVEYAISQKRKKGQKFAVVTLVFDDDVSVPGLLEPFVWKHVQNDLEGFTELVQALPLELGPARWKEGVS